MNKEVLKRLRLGVLSFSALALFAACGTDDTDDPAVDEDPAVEEPADDEMTDDEMTDDEMADDEMTDDEMADDEMEDDDLAGDLPEEVPDDELDVVGIAQGDGNFSTLVLALEEANLVETLQGEGPFTVFAPTDDAFETLLGELDITAEELLAQPDLEQILTYHVVPGNVLAADLTDGMTAETVNGEEVTFDLSGDPMVNESTIITTDIEASNGVVHAIDTVLVPSDFELQEVESE
ncbi:Uncaracterized surface protein containing fasciclin (FAS1) repeats [Alkalibacterium subtropicum]|uniref:Uncaracterized surface protein containing fasciclin (FAS1) repeats n=1 Tax=Alkalibacterium subtropicum TaxID=753702 RepID=A0A1I1IHG5_9LACT|nr:fasciclin domain-containing protein [Alkalibacterium subtropicum]SFC33648.1 Uncaracterized surface protein containing fasciclin (FAS1) repeats [Alkalibacterium subtropicum]